MLFKVVQFATLVSTAHIAYGATPFYPENVDVVKRHWIPGPGGHCDLITRYGGCQGARTYYYDDDGYGGNTNGHRFVSGGTAGGYGGVAQGGAGVAQGSVGVAQGGAGIAQGGAGILQGGAGILQGGAGIAQGGAGILQGGAGFAQGGIGFAQGIVGSGTHRSAGSAQGAAGVGASGGLNVMVEGWGQLTPASTQLHSILSSGASVDVAVKAAISFETQVRSVSSQFASCRCSRSPQAAAAFQEMAVKFFSSFQLTLQAAQWHYRAQWQSHFRPIFKQCGSAFVSIRDIAVSLSVDLGVILRLAQIDLQLFVGAGLNVSDLLRVNLSIGGSVAS